MHNRTVGVSPGPGLLAGLIVGATVAPAIGQLGLDQSRTSFVDRQRILQRENEDRQHRDIPLTQKLSVDYGGWFNTYFFLYDDGVDSSRTLRQYELRVWASVTADRGIHTGYARMRTTYLDWNKGDQVTAHEDDLDGPNLERGWYQFDVARALRIYGEKDIPFELRTKIGRDLVNVGTGYAISLPLDHVEIVGEWYDFETRFLVGRTPSSVENIDSSRSVADHSDRDFWVIEEKYKGFENHEPFVYVAWQNDHTREDPLDLLQNYQYDSAYVGFGSTGELIDNLRYSSEWVIERGESYGDQRYLYTNDIKAWAFDQRLDYYFRHKTKPVVSAEYMFASGDPKRAGSPTNAEGGLVGDNVDNGFVGFGFRDTGIAFAPQLSNIHIWRLGGSLRPLPDYDATKDLEIGTDYYLYWKNKKAAAVSDGLADEQSGYLGWEMDYYANYRILSDLSWTVRFGTFFPGSAFSDRSVRTFLLTGITWSF